jgi:hypothetical protein
MGKRQALVNEALTDAYFGGTAPLGTRIRQGSRSPTDIEIIGVVCANARHHDVRGDFPEANDFQSRLGHREDQPGQRLCPNRWRSGNR